MPPSYNSNIRDFAPYVVVFSSDQLCRLRAVPASAVFGVVFGSGRNPRAAAACTVNGDARGRRYLLGGVGMTLTLLPRAPGETLGPACRIGQRRRLTVVPFLKALLGLHVESPMWQLECGDARLRSLLLHRMRTFGAQCSQRQYFPDD